MRPERLELEGFTAFRERTEIDFTDAELFALVGPTGSGKSSIVDAITFALYGSIPRLPKGRVEPVISLGSEEARIRFDFTVGGASYTAVRVVKRTKQGATTPEARLEGPDVDVVGARELTDAIESLLGLSYEHFTKSVVLPQGAFAAFLLDGPSDRQALLRELLDLGRYGRVRDLAKARARDSEVRAQSLRDRVTELSGVTPEAIEALETRIAALGEVAEWMGEHRRAEENDRAQRDELARRRTRVAEIDTLLSAVAVPEDVTSLAAGVEAARTHRSELVDRREVLRATTTKLAEAAPEPDEVAAIVAALSALDRLAKTETRMAKGQGMIDEASKGLEAIDTRLAAAVAAHEEATTLRDRLTTTHRAHAIRATLDEGDECPVCGGTVGAANGTTPDGLEDAEQRVTATRQAVDALRAERAALEARSAAMIEQMASLRSDRDEAVAIVDGRTRDDLARTRDELASATAALSEARTELAEIDRRIDAAETAIGAAESATRESWAALDGLRLKVTELGPPPLERLDLAAEWRGFAEWGAASLADVRTDLAALDADVEELDERRRLRSEEARRRVTAAGVDTSEGDPHDVLVAAVARTREQLDRMREDLETKTTAAAQLEGYEGDMAVANSLVRHLNVNGFERWLVEEVLVELVALANGLLAQLSNGAYSLVVEGAEFRVVDHLNADERRSAMTLSGGETFVVSLALALSLAEQITSMSVTGTAMLESVFLDEGFGTLDPETLDTVASVIHELGASGRTVGLITHVSELAEQIPVRFKVSKRAGSSTVERVEA